MCASSVPSASRRARRCRAPGPGEPVAGAVAGGLAAAHLAGVDVERRRGDPAPVVEAPRAAHARPAQGGAQARVIEQGAQRARQPLRVARRDVHPGDTVDDGVDHPADRRGDDRDSAGHRLQRHDAERLVPRRADDDVRRAQQRGQLAALDPPAQVDAVGDAGRLRHAEQTLGLRVGEQLGAWRSAGDDELGVGQAGERLDHVADALALDHPPDAQQPPQSRATRIAGAVGTEELEIHPAGDHGELVPGGAEAQQLEDLVGAGGHDLIGAAHDVALDREALGRRGVLVALVAALDHSRARGRSGPPGTATSRAASSAACPDIQKWACTTSGMEVLHARTSSVGEGRHVLEQRVLGHRSTAAPR